jgi:peptidyl-tRNA hydrolase
MPIEPNPFDRPDLLELRKNQGDPIVIYLIVRKSLGMDVGKIAVQVGHGVGMLMGRYAEFEVVAHQTKLTDEEYPKWSITSEWLKTSYTKIAVVANDKDWEKIKEQLPVFLVKDAGLTEVAPGSETVLVTWPMKKSEAPKIIRRLQALKSRLPGVSEESS